MPARNEKTAEPTGTRQSGMAGFALPMAAGSVAAKALVNMGNETVRFVWERLQQDMETHKAMLACTNMEELRNIQTAHFAAAQKDYAAEAGKMLDLLTEATSAGLGAMAKGRRYDDIPF